MEDRIGVLEVENARLREQLASLQAKYDKLEESTSSKIQALIEENEALAEANHLLMENQAALERLTPALTAQPDASLSQIPDELLVPGEGIQTIEQATMESVHSAGNLLSVAIPIGKPQIAVTGGVDKYVAVHDWKRQRKLCDFHASGPVLDIAFNPQPALADYFVATYMDSKHAVLKLVDVDDTWHIEEVAQFQDHTRPGAMRVAWSSCGKLFATASCDKSVHVYSFDHGGHDSVASKIKSYYFNGIAEAIVFVPPPVDGSQNELLVIAVREDCYIHYVDCKTFEKERINMNQDGIEHVSYTIMDLRVAPLCGKYLLAATDKDRHFVFAVKSNVVYRNLYGHKAGPYSQPRVLWHPSEKYVISNTEDNGSLFVWCIASERMVEQISAHDKLVRGLTVSALGDGLAQLMSVSYDKRLKVWSSLASGSSQPL